MKIAIFSDSYYPQINGLVTAINLITNFLSKTNKIILIIPTKNYNSSNVKYKLDKNCQIISSPSIPFLFFPEYKIAIPFSLKILKILLKEKIDVIHTHTFFTLGILGLIIAKLRKIPIVHTYHTYFEEYLHYIKIPKKIGKFLLVLYSRFYCNNCDRVIVPTEMMKEVLISYGIKKEIIVVPTGIDRESFKNGNKRIWRKKLKIDKEKFLLLYVGRLAKEKNIFLLLECFKELRDELKDLYFLIVGDGPLRKEILKYIKENEIENYVKLTGFVSASEIKDIYACGDLFIFSSKTETQGLVILEAVSSNLPIVALREGGLKYVLPKKNVIGISAVKDKYEMLEKIKFYYFNLKKLQKLIERNLETFSEKWSIEMTIKNYESIYKTVIKEKYKNIKNGFKSEELLF